MRSVSNVAEGEGPWVPAGREKAHPHGTWTRSCTEGRREVLSTGPLSKASPPVAESPLQGRPGFPASGRVCPDLPTRVSLRGSERLTTDLGPWRLLWSREGRHSWRKTGRGGLQARQPPTATFPGLALSRLSPPSKGAALGSLEPNDPGARPVFPELGSTHQVQGML